MGEYGLPDHKKTFMQNVEGPKAVFAYRIVTGFAAVFTTTVLGIGITFFHGMSKDIVDIKVNAALALGRNELLSDRVHVLSNRLMRTDDRVDKLSDRVTTIQTGRP